MSSRYVTSIGVALAMASAHWAVYGAGTVGSELRPLGKEGSGYGAFLGPPMDPAVAEVERLIGEPVEAARSLEESR